MKFNRAGRWYISFITHTGFLLFAVRLNKWRVGVVHPPMKPTYVRWYFGPFEIERSSSKGT